VTIRPAIPTDAETLTRIAHDAKKHWGYPDHWLEHWRDDLTITPEFVTANSVYVAEQDGSLVGFYALVSGKDKTELDHLWVTPARIGTGVGKELFLHAMQTAAGQNIATVEILSDPNAADFYRKMGAHQVGEASSEIDGEQRVLPRLAVDPKGSGQ
jgi:GNAT superfamily N-acetyltransferase